MGEPQSDSLPPDDERGYYQLYRQRIDREDDLVHQRVTWLLTGQSILFAAWGMSAKQGGTPPAASTAVLVAVGLAVCVVLYPGILAALVAIEGFRREYEAGCRGRKLHPALPKLVGGSRAHWCGLVAPLALPPLAAVGWLLIWAFR
jgi:hypothetical protein